MKVRSFLKWGFSLVVLWVLCCHFRVSWASGASFVHSPGWLAGACAIPLMAIPFFSVNRWKLFLTQLGIHERFWSLWKINWIALFQGLVVPSSQGYDVLRMWHLAKRHPGCSARATGSVLVERIFGLWVFVTMAVTGLIFAWPLLDNPRPVTIAVGAFAVAVTVGSALLLNRRLYAFYSRKISNTPKWGRITKFLRDTHESLVNFSFRKVFLSSMVYISLFQLSTILVGWFLFRACGQSVPFGIHLAFYPVIATFALLPVTIGGFGLREGGFAYFYPLVGVPPDIAIAVSVLNYLVLNLLPAVLGGILWLLDFRERKANP